MNSMAPTWFVLSKLALGLIAITAVVALIVALTRRPKVGLAVLGMLVLLMVIGYFAALVGVRRSPVAVAIIRDAPPPRGSAASAIPNTAILSIEQAALPADIYPSRQTAVRQLARQIVASVRETQPSETGVAETSIAIRDDHHTSGLRQTELIKQLRDLIQAALPEVRTSYGDATGPATDRSHAIDLEVVFTAVAPQWVSWSNDRMPGGVIHIYGTFPDPADSRSFSARFIEKSWADDWTGFVNQTEPGKRWLRAESAMLCSSEQEARTEAHKAATNQLVPYVRSRMNSRTAMTGLASTDIKLMVNDEFIARQVAGSLQREEAIVVADRFVQRFSRPYGDVWREQVLIDASPQKIDELVNFYTRVAQAQLGKTVTNFGTLGVLVGIILLAYAFLNAATKGYFVWRLRAAALLLAIVAVLVVVAVL
jgi:hypothetical protein